MENYRLLINHEKSNDVEFDITIDGLGATTSVFVRFVIDLPDFSLMFECKNREGSKWTANLPSLPFLEKETYPFKIEVIADGYHFIPSCGMVDIVSKKEIHVTNAESNPTKAPSITAAPQVIQHEINQNTNTAKIDDTQQNAVALQIADIISMGGDNESTIPSSNSETLKTIEQPQLTEVSEKKQNIFFPKISVTENHNNDTIDDELTKTNIPVDPNKDLKIKEILREILKKKQNFTFKKVK